MRPTKLMLSNWCQHRDLEIILNPGMNMIQGPNGSGKSNIIDALGTAISAESSNSQGKSSKKTDNITIGYDRGKVILEFEHKGVVGYLTTALKRNYKVDSDVLDREKVTVAQLLADQDQSGDVTDQMLEIHRLNPHETFKRKLEWNGEVYEKKTEIDSWIQSAVGLPPAAIRARYFPTQGNIDSLITGNSEDRYKALAEQAQVTLCPVVYRKLGEEISSRPDMSGVEEEYRSSQLELADASKALEEAKRDREEVEKRKVNADEVLKIIHSYQAADSSRKQYAEYEQKMFGIKNDLKATKEKMDRVVDEGKRLRSVFDDKSSRKEYFQQVVSSYREQQHRLETRRNLIESIESEKETYNSLEAVDEPDSSARDQAYKDMVEASVEEESIRKKISVFSENSECPTCGHVVDDTEQFLKDAKKELDEKSQKRIALKKKFEDEDAAYNQKLSEYKSYIDRKSRCESRLGTLQENLDMNPEPENIIDEAKYSEAVEGIEEIEQLQANLDKKKSAYTDIAVRYKDIDSQLKSAQDILDRSKKDIDNSPTLEEFKKATKDYADFQLYEQERNRAERELTQKQTLYDEAKRIAEKWESKYSALKGERSWTGLLRSARDLFHKNSLPREAILWYANRLIEVTSSYLREFDTDFDIMMGDDTSFLAIKNSGDILPSYRLSGGQMNMLNLSIRFAYADLYPSSFQFLELDEVEVHLDPENVSRLPSIFEKAKNLAKDKDLVVLFISHHPSLSDLSDHVISL